MLATFERLSTTLLNVIEYRRKAPMRQCRAPEGEGVGVVSAWFALPSSKLAVFNHARTDMGMDFTFHKLHWLILGGEVSPMVQVPERRQSARSRLLLKGIIVFHDPKLPRLDCLVRDISAGGARITVAETVAVASRFQLVIPQRNQQLDVCVCWRAGAEVGVAFEEAALQMVGPDPALRIRELEAEVAELRERLAEMKRRERALAADQSPPAGGLRQAG